MASRRAPETGQNVQVSAARIRADFRNLRNPEIAAHSARFFRSVKGEYGEGDRFLGIRVPETRRMARRYRHAPLRSVLSLMKSRYHEERLLAVIMLANRYERGDEASKQRVFDAYVAHREYVNNWDLVDSSAPRIIGAHLEHRSRELLYDLAAAASVWDRRIAVLATLHFIRNRDFEDALRLARRLRDDEHDLVHKAVGWMLREVGNRDKSSEVSFLRRNHRRMPRTMLRYAIEKFPPAERRAWLSGTV